MTRWLRASKRAFEFRVYLYLFLYSSLFMFILTLNDVISCDFAEPLDIISFFVSIVTLIMLLCLMILPVGLIIKYWKPEGPESESESVNAIAEKEEGEEKSVLEDFWYSYTKGVKKKVLARLFYTVTMMKHL